CYEKKYSRPLSHALKKELSGDFRRAACAWVNALSDPSGGLEGTTEQEVDTLSSDPEALRKMLQAARHNFIQQQYPVATEHQYSLMALLTEHSSLLTFLAELDAETIAEACKGWGTDDTRLIKTITSRSKQHLARVSKVGRLLPTLPHHLHPIGRTTPLWLWLDSTPVPVLQVDSPPLPVRSLTATS
ncbi:MAG: hypothetical protein SGPRY_013852, partial [Prymnesium sp.]